MSEPRGVSRFENPFARGEGDVVEKFRSKLSLKATLVGNWVPGVQNDLRSRSESAEVHGVRENGEYIFYPCNNLRLRQINS